MIRRRRVHAEVRRLIEEDREDARVAAELDEDYEMVAALHSLLRAEALQQLRERSAWWYEEIAAAGLPFAGQPAPLRREGVGGSPAPSAPLSCGYCGTGFPVAAGARVDTFTTADPPPPAEHVVSVGGATVHTCRRGVASNLTGSDRGGRDDA